LHDPLLLKPWALHPFPSRLQQQPSANFLNQYPVIALSLPIFGIILSIRVEDEFDNNQSLTAPTVVDKELSLNQFKGRP